jgi:hypothetical protein
MSEHRVGIVGVGGIAATHHRELSRLRGVTIAGITDVDPAHLRQRSQEWYVPAFASVAALLASDIESVFMCTPPLAHVVRDPHNVAAWSEDAIGTETATKGKLREFLSLPCNLCVTCR